MASQPPGSLSHSPPPIDLASARHAPLRRCAPGCTEPEGDDGDPALVAAALGDIARAVGMTEIARETGLGRESLYKALSPEGNPEFATIMKVVRALGLRIYAKAG